MSILNILKNLSGHKNRINLEELPTQGLFYKDDFYIEIKKADISDIIAYEINFEHTIFSMITEIKKIIMNNCVFPNNYSYLDIISVDVIYIFFEIIKLTNSKPITISYDDDFGNIKEIEISSDTYNYFDFTKYMRHYNKEEYLFNIDGYKFSMPTFGVENSITDFLISKHEDFEAYDSYSYDFRYFLSSKNSLTFDEIDNLLIIFNDDMKQGEKLDIRRLVSKFDPIVLFSLKKDDKIIDVQSKIDLKNIWK